jgi:hypothetical protein
MTPGRFFLGLLNHQKCCLETRDVKISQGHEVSKRFVWESPINRWMIHLGLKEDFPMATESPKVLLGVMRCQNGLF